MRIALPILLALGVSTSLSAQSLSTGTAPWRTASVSSSSVGCTPGGAAVTTNNGWWTAPSGGQWVGCAANDGPGWNMQSGLTVTYTFSLDLNAVAPAGGTFSFRYAADNSVAFTFGDGITGITGATSCNTGTCFVDLSGPVTGMFGTTNAVITARVTNTAVIGDNNPTGLLVIGTASSTVVPEPQTYALVAAGLLLLGAARAARRGARTAP
jgi:hypothetical protein